MMLYASGNGRCDIEALKYFSDFRCSDNSDPVERLYIQWGFSQFIPVKAMQAHVTERNLQAGIKFRIDVAMMCKLRFDINIDLLTPEEKEQCILSVDNYKHLKKVILDGDMFHTMVGICRLCMLTVLKVRQYCFATTAIQGIMKKIENVKLQGLLPAKNYQVKEINLLPNQRSNLDSHGETFSGDCLMKIGLSLFSNEVISSKVIKIIEQ